MCEDSTSVLKIAENYLLPETLRKLILTILTRFSFEMPFTCVAIKRLYI